jgi:Flp pilus assembly pilin Flp
MKKILKNEKGFTAVEGLLIILILVVIGAVGYMVYHNNHKTTATTVTNPYAGWLSYTNKAGGYTIRYPSSWTIEGSSNSSGSAISASQLNGEEDSILLYYPSSKINSFGIWINNNTKYETDADGEGDGISEGTANYSDGNIIKTLSNGMSIWAITSTSTSTSYGDADIEAVTGGTFGYKVDSGAILQISMGFQYAYGESTNLTYNQQMNSSELQTAYTILSSLK